MSSSRSRRCKGFESRPSSSLKPPTAFFGGCRHVLFRAGDEHSLAVDPCWRRASAAVEGFESRPIRSTRSTCRVTWIIDRDSGRETVEDGDETAVQADWATSRSTRAEHLVCRFAMRARRGRTRTHVRNVGEAWSALRNAEVRRWREPDLGDVRSHSSYAEISTFDEPWRTSIRRGLASSATGIDKISTPSSY